jgi:hypothetical protein
MTSLSDNIGLIAFTTVCFGGVLFLLWFLIELQLDERLMREQSGRSWKAAPTVKTIPINSNRPSLVYSTRRLREPNVLRLSDKNIDKNTRELRWLVMLLLLSATMQLSLSVWM